MALSPCPGHDAHNLEPMALPDGRMALVCHRCGEFRLLPPPELPTLPVLPELPIIPSVPTTPWIVPMPYGVPPYNPTIFWSDQTNKITVSGGVPGLYVELT